MYKSRVKLQYVYPQKGDVDLCANENRHDDKCIYWNNDAGIREIRKKNLAIMRHNAYVAILDESIYRKKNYLLY